MPSTTQVFVASKMTVGALNIRYCANYQVLLASRESMKHVIAQQEFLLPNKYCLGALLPNLASIDSLISGALLSEIATFTDRITGLRITQLISSAWVSGALPSPRTS